MSGQIHITHRYDYLRGRLAGKADALNGSDYRPGDGWPRNHDDTNGKRAYHLGYEDGWAGAYPCDNGTCDHPAHR